MNENINFDYNCGYRNPCIGYCYNPQGYKRLEFKFAYDNSIKYYRDKNHHKHFVKDA